MNPEEWPFMVFIRKKTRPGPISTSFLSLSLSSPDFHSMANPDDKTRVEISTFGQKLEGFSILSAFDTM